MKNSSRREILKIAATWGFALPFIQNAFQSVAFAGKNNSLPAGQKEAPPTDPLVMALGYKTKAKDVDLEKFQQLKRPEAQGQSCKTCALFVKVNDGWGKCQMIQSGLVATGGLCSTWQKKA